MEEQPSAGVGDARQSPFVVVLTGGPCSGKSSALALLRSRLSARGFQVLTVPENATHFFMNSDGFQPEWAGTPSQVRMQRIFLDFQIAQEDAFKEFAALHPTKPAVVLLDCCTLSSKMYLSDGKWQELLKLPGRQPLSEAELLTRYDLVIHLVTCAFGGHYEWGPGSSNPGRYHTPEQAQESDQRSLQVFEAHPQLRVVPHCGDFEDKIGKVVEFVNDALHVEGLAGRRCRRICKVVRHEDLSAVVACASTSASVVTCTFLDHRLRHSVRQHAKVPTGVWLQQFDKWRASGSAESPVDAGIAAGIVEATGFMYERRSQVQLAGGPPGSTCMQRRVIGEEDYRLAVASCGHVPAASPGSPNVGAGAATTKFVLRFVADSCYFELFFFMGHGDLVLDLPAEEGDLPGSAPGWLELSHARQLAKQDSVASVASAASAGARHPGPSGEESAPPLKRARSLRPHSTEEAALFGC